VEQITVLDTSFHRLKWLLKTTNAKSIEEHLMILRPQDNFDKFFKKSIYDVWPKKGDIPDLDIAIQIISNAVVNNIKIGIIGDYDVDGSSATGLLVAYFTKINANFTYHIPNRFTEGYGVSRSIIEKLLAQNVEIIITVDNGTTAYDAINCVKENQKKLIILDHHHIQETINVDAFVNPHRNHTGFEILCATGVVFIFLVELNNFLYNNRLIEEKINIYNYVDVAAVATICDVMPLVNFNRALVALGIKKLNTKPLVGYAAILHEYIGNIDCQTVGFSLGPCINAPGRLGSAQKAVELVTETDEKKARILAADLIKMNLERREIEKDILIKAEKQIDERFSLEQFANKQSIVVYGDWFEGVVGIIAGRIKDKYNKPACVLTKNEGMWKGSLRSVHGFHIGNAVKKAIDSGYAKFGGGHDMAGGISLEESQLDDFINFLENEAKIANLKPSKEISIDAMVSLSTIPKLIGILENFGPFGPNNPDPIFFFPNCIITYKKNTQKSCMLTLSSPNFKNSIDMWIFNPEERILQALNKNDTVHIIGTIVKNKDKTQIKMIDFAVNKKIN
jgi:single-stranded-DNA-specific exonuclease